MEQANSADKIAKEVKRTLAGIKRDCKAWKSWEEDAKKIVRRYRNEKQEALESVVDPDSRYNIFFSNVQTLVPSLYARTPVPQAERRHKDKDEYARVAAEVLERASRFQIEDYDFDTVMVSSVLDVCLLGRGTARIRYSDTRDAAGNKLSEAVTSEYVFWRDFSHSPARSWDEVEEVRFRLYLSKDDAVKTFGEKAHKLKYKHVAEGLEETDTRDPGDTGETDKKAEVWEVWKKKTRTVCWVSHDYSEDYLLHMEDPLKLKTFFPCPRPLYGTLTTDSLVPVPDYNQYRHLANSLDTLIKKEQALIDGLKVAGCYDSLLDGELQQLVNTHDNRLIPVKNWPSFAKSGGVDGAISWWPLDRVIQAIGVIQQEKASLKNDVYEITGWSDIMRGVSDPNETAAAQQIKGKFSSIRLTRRQSDVQRFAKELIALKAEVMAELYEPQTFMAMTGLEFVPDMPAMPPGPNGEPPPPITPEMSFQYKQEFYLNAIRLLRNDAMRRFKIDIETDSTLAIDEALDKASKQEYAGAVSTFVQGLGQLAPQIPTMVPALLEVLSVLARGYKAGRGVEAALEQGIEETKRQLEAAKSAPPKPDPKLEIEQMKAHSTLQIEQMKAQNQQQLAMLKQDADTQKIALEHERKVRELEFQMFIDKMKTESDIKLEQVQAEADASIKLLEARIKSLEMAPRSSGVGASKAGGNIQLSLDIPRKPRKVIALGKGPDGNRRYQIADDDADEAPTTEVIA